MSSKNDPLLLVSREDQVLGTLEKDLCHAGFGQLHRAFSLFVFNGRGQLLLQQRAKDKALWAQHWSNTCCSHPREDGDMEAAVHQRLQEELRISATMVKFVYKFIYQANFFGAGSEHELCHVFVGQTDEQPRQNPEEVAQVRWIDPNALDLAILDEPKSFTPWFLDEWQTLRTHFPHVFVRAA